MIYFYSPPVPRSVLGFGLLGFFDSISYQNLLKNYAVMGLKKKNSSLKTQ